MKKCGKAINLGSILYLPYVKAATVQELDKTHQ
jgi:hypothetical protein